jgi:HlyD family secretion protein
MKHITKRTSVLFICAGLLAWCNEKEPQDRIRMSGTVEVNPVKIMPLIGGRILELNLTEGDKVTEGDLLARIDCTELELQLKQAEAAVKGANAQLQLIEEGARKEDIRWMRQVIKQAKIQNGKLEKDLDVFGPLVKGGAMSQKEYDDLTTAKSMAEAKLAEAQQQYIKMIKGARPEEVEAALSLVEQAEAMVNVIKQKQTYCTITAPASGTVMHRLAEPGEAAAPGIPLGVVADLSRVKVKGYIAEAELGHVRLGGAAHVYIDSHPGKPLKGKITYISDEAEFTPKNIQTRDERVKTVYEVQVSLDNSAGLLKSGMPADIVIRKK